MNTKDYVRKYKLDNPRVDTNKFNRDAFLKDFGIEFKEKLNQAEVRAKGHYPIGFPEFQSIVKSMQDKFNAISNKKLGMPLTQELFNAFFAIHVIPERARLFPEKHEEITSQREKNMENQESHYPFEDDYYLD